MTDDTVLHHLLLIWHRYKNRQHFHTDPKLHLINLFAFLFATPSSLLNKFTDLVCVHWGGTFRLAFVIPNCQGHLIGSKLRMNKAAIHNVK